MVQPSGGRVRRLVYGSTTGVCPKGTATAPGLLGYGWASSGTLKNDDTLIEGVDFVDGGTVTWSFER